MSRKQQMTAGRTVRYFHAPYETAMAQIESDRGRLFNAVRRAWASPPAEETARRIGASAHDSGMSFDEVLFYLWEQLCNHGSGAIWMDGTETLKLKAH